MVQVTKTFREVPTVSVTAFQEARAFQEEVLNGRVNPSILERLVEKAKALMNSRKMAGRRRPSHGNLTAKANAEVVRRPSGLFVPPKYRDA